MQSRCVKCGNLFIVVTEEINFCDNCDRIFNSSRTIHSKRMYTPKDEDHYIRDKLKSACEKWEEVMSEINQGIINRDKIVSRMDDFNSAVKHCISKGKECFLEEFGL